MEDDKPIGYLGRNATDMVSGFSGIVTGHAVYLSNRVSVEITATAEENKRPEAAWFDIELINFGDRAITL